MYSYVQSYIGTGYDGANTARVDGTFFDVIFVYTSVNKLRLLFICVFVHEIFLTEFNEQ